MDGTPAGRRERPLGFYLTRSSFPGDRARLLGDARRASAPESIVQVLRRLPDDSACYRDLAELSKALDGRGDGPTGS